MIIEERQRRRLSCDGDKLIGNPDTLPESAVNLVYAKYVEVN
jgi:hypothetical protein